MRRVSLPELVKRERKARGLSMRELALAVGTSEENIRAIEDGRNRQPSVEILRGISSVLGIPLVRLLLAMANEPAEWAEPQLAGLPDFRTYVRLLFPDDPDSQDDLMAIYNAKIKRRKRRRGESGTEEGTAST